MIAASFKFPYSNPEMGPVPAHLEFQLKTLQITDPDHCKQPARWRTPPSRWCTPPAKARMKTLIVTITILTVVTTIVATITTIAIR